MVLYSPMEGKGPGPAKSLKHGILTLIFVAYLLHCGYCSVSNETDAIDLTFTAEASDVVVSKNASVLLDCGVPAGWQRIDTSPVVEWKRDGILLNLIADTRRSILSNGSLLLSSVQHSKNERTDEGVYQCVATLPSVGTMLSRSAKLQVSSMARFEEEPRDVTVRVHDVARFNCYVQAAPVAKVSWIKDDQPLYLDETRMTILASGALEIEQVQLLDQGYYRCNVSNTDKSRISSEAKLSVLSELEGGVRPEAPTFLGTPHDVVSVTGGAGPTSVTLECAANGNPRPDITWLKDGTTIDLENLDSRFRRKGSGSLFIKDVTESDDGVYQCRAENTEDSADVTATLQVHVPPRFIQRPHSVVANEKEDAELQCQIYGRPQPTIQWTKNGELIIESEYFQIVNGYNLKILGLVASDFGIYQCIGSNAAGNIQAAASLSILSTDHNDTSLDISLTVDADPSVLDDVSDDDAQDVKGSTTPSSASSEQTTVDGDDHPLPSAPRDVEALIVSSRFVTLRWKEPTSPNGDVIGYSVLYRQEGSERERVVNTSRSHSEEVNVGGLQPEKTYSVRIVAFNQHGAGSSSDALQVETKSEPHVLQAPSNLLVNVLSSVSLMAEWQSPPSPAATPVHNYKLFYMERGSGEEHEILTSHTSHLIHGLKPYTEYSVWAVALNEKGPGTSTEEITVRTRSDVPSDTPRNLVAEPASSTSVIVRWDAPAKEHQNGVITGYKIRYKPKSRGRPLHGMSGGGSSGMTATTDGSRRLFTLTGLQRETEYQLRVSALTVNGSGPTSEWILVETFGNDLDESLVPEPPSSLRARPMTSSISVSWIPPSNQNVMVRGYTIGWGKGIPDVYSKLVDGKQRVFVIEKLEPNSEYVISLRAYNQMGDGRPIYETVRTREESVTEAPTPLIPPVGLKAVVLSSTTVVLYWTDTTLPRNQIVTDSRYYVVRYTSTHTSSNPRYRYLNSTLLNCMLDELKPNTQFEFAVKVIKNRKESPWSLVVPNTTFEASPSSPPRDLTVVPVEENSSAINLNWQPPKQPNGQITGYVIFYTTDSTQRDRDWVVEGVVGDKMTTTVKGLTPDTSYFIKIQARNNKGYGPFSNVIPFRTSRSNGMVFQETVSSTRDARGISSTTLYIILAVAAGIILILLGVVLIVVFRRRDGGVANSPDRSKKGYVKGNVKVGKLGKADNPPDLWIHHDQMEMKGIDKSQRSNSVNTVSPVMRRSQDLDSLDGMPSSSTAGRPSNPTDSLDRRVGYITTYAGGTNSLRRPIKPKSLLISIATTQPAREPVATVTPVPNGSLNQHSESRPVFPVRQTYAAPAQRAHITIDASNQPCDNSFSTTTSYDSRSSLINPAAGGLPSALANDIKQRNNQGHPLKSFTVPAPPPPSAPPIKIVSPINNRQAATVNPSSPYKKILGPVSPPVLQKAGARVTAGANDLRPLETIQASYSTEELNQEMANLEGLMKDLNAITASSEFSC